jgi:hypothetical protein
MARIFEGSPEDHLFIEEITPGLVRVMYQPSQKKVEHSERFSQRKAGETKRKLLEISGPKHHFCIYPLNTLPTHDEFLQPKYRQITSIILEGFDFEVPASVENVRESLEDLPSGLIKDFEFGLGFVKDYRVIINVIEQIPPIGCLIISKENPTGISGDCYTISFKDYDAIRRGINRITKQQQTEGARDKLIFSYNSLLTSLDPKAFPKRTRPYKKDTIFKLILGDGNAMPRLSSADQSAAVRLIDQNRQELAENEPEVLLRLRNDIELVTLEVLIGKYEGMLAKNLQEARWQAFFNENTFILNLAFGYPVIKIQDQAHVGGQTLAGTGDTITDFLVKNGISNNAALFEIKTPGTPLLNKTPYRGQLYTPSSDLSGAVNQMLDQRREFQKDIARIKESSRIYDLETYALHGVLIVGTTPEGVDQQKSFELFRGNSKDITIITFDELLAKLKLLQEFLVSHSPEARQAGALRQLETRLLHVQDQLQGLYTYTESRSGSIAMATTKPLPGVDGRTVMTTLGKLTILKQGFDRTRVQTPPYYVGLDQPTERTIAVTTIDEFIQQSEKIISGAETELASQLKNRQ